MNKKTSPSPQPLKIVISRLINSQWLIVSFIIFLIIGFSSYLSGRNQIISQRQSTLLFAKSASAYFKNAVNLVRTLAAISPSQEDLEVVHQSSKLIDSLYIIKSDGHLYAIAPDNSQIKIGMDMSGHPNFQNGLNSYIQSKPFISPRTGNPTVYISYPFDNGAGLLVGELNLTGFEDNLIVMNLSKGINFYLTDASGVFLSHSNFEMVKQQQNIGYLNLFTNSSEEIESHVVRDHGKIKYSIVTKIPQTDWYAITETQILAIYGVILYPAIFGLLLIGLIFLFIVRREREMVVKQVVNPISELDRLALSISQGRYSKSDLLDVSSGLSEIDTLASSFEFMRQAIENHTEELRKSEEKYRTVADFTYDWEAWRLPDGTYRYVSPSCERISGHKAEEFINNPNLLLDIVVPEDKPIVQEHLNAIKSNNHEQAHNLDFRIINANGEIRWISHWCAAVFGEQGDFLGRRESNRDITDRKAKELELEKWGQIFENAEWGIAIGSADGKFVELFNPAYARMHGYEPEELKGLKIPDLYLPGSQAEIAKNIELAHQKGHHVWESLHVHKDGHTFPVIMDVTTVKDEKGNVKYRVVNVQDVTEKRKIENELRLSETKFSTAFRTSPDSININRMSDGLYIEINEGFTLLTGYTRDDVNGKTSREIDIWVKPEDRKRLVKGLREAGIVNNLEAQFRTKNGEIKSCLMSARVIEVEGVQCILSMTRDLTDRLKAEVFLKNLITMSPVSIQVLDSDGYTLEVNPAFQKLFGSVPPPDYSLFTDRQLAEKGLDVIFDDLKNGKTVVFPDVNFNPHDSIPELPDNPTWVRTIGYPIYTNNDKPDRFVLLQEDITARRQAEETIRESAEYFKASFEFANIGACMVGKNGEFLNVNDEYCSITGYSRTELLQLSFNDVTHPEDKTIGMDVHKKMLANEINQGTFEKRYIQKSGNVIWVRISNASVRDVNGDLKYVIAYVLDINEEKEAARIIRESEANLKNAQKYAHIGSWVWHIKTNLLDWSDEMFRIFGIDKDSFTGNLQDVISNAIHPDDRQKVEDSNRSVFEEGKPIPVEYRIIWPDDSVHVVWAEAGELVPDENGEPALLKGTVQDITERKKWQEELRESEEKNRLLISQMHQGLAVHEIILDESGIPVDYRFLDVNESFERLTGLKAKDIIGKTVLEVLPGTEKSWIEKYGRVALTGEPIEFEDIHSELGKYYGVVAYSPQPNQFAVIVSDISDRKQKEIQLKEQMDELQRWHNVTLGREDRIRELKIEVNKLLSKHGAPIRYPSVVDDPDLNQ
ncbi:MAG: hypothetical protein CVU42_05560 [Chloroflexi bacterium HGW-Chloroflexi-4]|jgi:PAS domain S-box-containing protein|nr:MAG: hypothetical protein CVU42_05560 [Chloroflexi bacterium HGW-Chloroflexi-4]